jgi:hypothetical protein
MSQQMAANLLSTKRAFEKIVGAVLASNSNSSPIREFEVPSAMRYIARYCANQNK